MIVAIGDTTLLLYSTAKQLRRIVYIVISYDRSHCVIIGFLKFISRHFVKINKGLLKIALYVLIYKSHLNIQ